MIVIFFNINSDLGTRLKQTDRGIQSVAGNSNIHIQAFRDVTRMLRGRKTFRFQSYTRAFPVKYEYPRSGEASAPGNCEAFSTPRDRDAGRKTGEIEREGGRE